MSITLLIKSTFLSVNLRTVEKRKIVTNHHKRMNIVNIVLRHTMNNNEKDYAKKVMQISRLSETISDRNRDGLLNSGVKKINRD